ncbi:MAG: DUF2281 domain-containing protein [Chitinophagales bacterium]|nr:DUF2281 domain-containing protein [Chitinophagales bacterium]
MENALLYQQIAELPEALKKEVQNFIDNLINKTIIYRNYFVYLPYEKKQIFANWQSLKD